MNTNILVAALIGIVVGAGGTALIGTNSIETKDNDSMMNMHGAMGSMMVSLSGKTGDALDKAFLEEMIVHHEGAVEMAEAILANGKHTELKQMADAIISAQTAEIKQMQDWQKSWYGAQ